MKIYNLLWIPLFAFLGCQSNALEKIKGTLITNETRYSIGTQIKMVRQQNNMTIHDFAKAFDLVEYNVQSLESDRAWPTRELLIQIQDSLNIKFEGVN